MHLLASTLIIVFSLENVKNWDLSNYNISENYYVSSLTSYGNRVFLTLPRSVCFNNVTAPTLLEVTWFNSENSFGTNNDFNDHQQWNVCAHLQDAVSVDMEILKARLWILDKGNAKCKSKILVYELYKKNNYATDIPFDGLGHKLSTLVVDNDKVSTTRAYIGLDGESFLLMFSLMDFQWRKVTLRSRNDFLAISTKYLAISRKEVQLFVTGSREQSIFSVDMSVLRKKQISDEISVTYCGEKLGNSSGLICDFKGGLYYYLVHDYAIVRWNTKFTSEAINYNVIAQSYEQLPYVSQLFIGPQNGVWALVNTGDPSYCGSPHSVPLETRIVKLVKYNTFNLLNKEH